MNSLFSLMILVSFKFIHNKEVSKHLIHSALKLELFSSQRKFPTNLHHSFLNNVVYNNTTYMNEFDTSRYKEDDLTLKMNENYKIPIFIFL